MRLRKSYFSAAAISFAVLVVTAILAVIILMLIPSTPLAKQFQFLAYNHESPAAYNSDYFVSEGRAVGWLDFWVTLPLMLIAGAALGLKLAPKASRRETVFYAVLTSAVFSALIFFINLSATLSTQEANLQAVRYGLISRFDLRYVLAAAGTAILWIALYTAGAVTALVTRQRLAPPSPPPTSRRKPAKRSVASTSP